MKKAIRFTAPWCHPCKTYTPIWNSISEERTDWVFETVDIDENHEIASKYSIRSIPTTVFVSEDDNLIAKYTGVLQKNDLNTKLNEW
jgi:thioredoxin-like negative regulator of GroEL